VIDDNESGMAADGVHQLGGVLNRNGNVRFNRRCTRSFTNMAHSLTNRAVALAVDENLAPRPEVQRPQYRVDGRGRVLYENQVLRFCADETAELERSIAQCRRQHVAQELI